MSTQQGELNGFMEKSVKVEVDDGFVQPGVLTFKPGNKSLTIALHGFAGRSESYTILSLRNYLVSHNLASDFLRYKMTAANPESRKFHDGTDSNLVKDVKAIIANFGKDYDTIYIVGLSQGGTIAMQVCDERVSKTYAYDPPLFYQKLWEFAVSQAQDVINQVDHKTYKETRVHDLPFSVSEAQYTEGLSGDVAFGQSILDNLSGETHVVTTDDTIGQLNRGYLNFEGNSNITHEHKKSGHNPAGLGEDITFCKGVFNFFEIQPAK